MQSPNLCEQLRLGRITKQLHYIYIYIGDREPPIACVSVWSVIWGKGVEFQDVNWCSRVTPWIPPHRTILCINKQYIWYIYICAVSNDVHIDLANWLLAGLDPKRDPTSDPATPKSPIDSTHNRKPRINPHQQQQKNMWKRIWFIWRGSYDRMNCGTLAGNLYIYIYIWWGMIPQFLSHRANCDARIVQHVEGVIFFSVVRWMYVLDPAHQDVCVCVCVLYWSCRGRISTFIYTKQAARRIHDH